MSWDWDLFFTVLGFILAIGLVNHRIDLVVIRIDKLEGK